MPRAWADVDLEAVRHNVRTLQELAAPAALCAVVKANGYGHGAVPVARAALEAGAASLAVAQVDEAVALRDAGIDAPVLLLSEPHPDEIDAAIATGARLTVYTSECVVGVAKAVRRARARAVPVHLKVDTGMHRVGVHPDDALALAKATRDLAEVELEGVCTHCPVADEPDNTFTARQILRFEAVLDALQAAGIDPGIVHAANSAATLMVPESRYSMVRCGIALYGVPPAPALAGVADLRPALTVTSEVSFVKEVPAGEGVSYGLRQSTDRDTVVATVPVGYADGVFRSLPLAGQDVLIGGVRRPIIGVVTMDQLMVDCGPGADVVPGDPVVLLGAQGDERITPDDWAARLGTIAYEVVCAVGPRVERRYTS
jgi:alanine racemase